MNHNASYRKQIKRFDRNARVKNHINADKLTKISVRRVGFYIEESPGYGGVQLSSHRYFCASQVCASQVQV